MSIFKDAIDKAKYTAGAIYLSRCYNLNDDEINILNENITNGVVRKIIGHNQKVTAKIIEERNENYKEVERINQETSKIQNESNSTNKKNNSIDATNTTISSEADAHAYLTSLMKSIPEPPDLYADKPAPWSKEKYATYRDKKGRTFADYIKYVREGHVSFRWDDGIGYKSNDTDDDIQLRQLHYKMKYESYQIEKKTRAGYKRIWTKKEELLQKLKGANFGGNIAGLEKTESRVAITVDPDEKRRFKVDNQYKPINTNNQSDIFLGVRAWLSRTLCYPDGSLFSKDNLSAKDLDLKLNLQANVSDIIDSSILFRLYELGEDEKAEQYIRSYEDIVTKTYRRYLNTFNSFSEKQLLKMWDEMMEIGDNYIERVEWQKKYIDVRWIEFLDAMEKIGIPEECWKYAYNERVYAFSHKEYRYEEYLQMVARKTDTNLGLILGENDKSIINLTEYRKESSDYIKRFPLDLCELYMYDIEPSFSMDQFMCSASPNVEFGDYGRECIAYHEKMYCIDGRRENILKYLEEHHIENAKIQYQNVVY